MCCSKDSGLIGGREGSRGWRVIPLTRRGYRNLCYLSSSDFGRVGRWGPAAGRRRRLPRVSVLYQTSKFIPGPMSLGTIGLETGGRWHGHTGQS